MDFRISVHVVGNIILFLVTLILCDQQLQFVRIDNLSNYKFDNELTLESSSGSLEDCAVQCEITKACLSLQHASNTNECVLFRTIHYSTLKAVSVPGWNYFIRTGGRCQSGFSDARSIKVCVYFTGIYSVFDGHKECSQLNSELINIRSDVEEDLLETLMCSLFDDDNKSNANKAYIQGRWNGTHWVLDDGKAMEHSMQWTTNTDLSKLQYGDRLSFYPKGHKIAINNGNLARPIFCAYDIV